MAHIFSGENTSQLYINALSALALEGYQCSPRGKRIKEIRPAIFEFTKPTNRVTFLHGRVINPFFQMAESLWILAGLSSVKWLTDYNSSISQFSDNGVHFNAPYGERLRFWNKNDSQSFVFNPIDQLQDVYRKLSADRDTRQAVAVIYNPMFDNSHYTLDRKGLDQPCNLILTFKIRDNKLDLTVFNRSNDLHWGVMGANLCQFSTIQETMASWLGVQIGTYYQITDSLHIYLDDYGAGETNKILSAYGVPEELVHTVQVEEFMFTDEPRISSSMMDFEAQLEYYFNVTDLLVRSSNTYTDSNLWEALMCDIEQYKDDYLKLTFLMMVAYQAHKSDNVDKMLYTLAKIPDCSWKVSGLRFLSKKYSEHSRFKMLYEHMSSKIISYIDRRDV